MTSPPKVDGEEDVPLSTSSLAARLTSELAQGRADVLGYLHGLASSPRVSDEERREQERLCRRLLKRQRRARQQQRKEQSAPSSTTTTKRKNEDERVRQAPKNESEKEMRGGGSSGKRARTEAASMSRPCSIRLREIPVPTPVLFSTTPQQQLHQQQPYTQPPLPRPQPLQLTRVADARASVVSAVPGHSHLSSCSSSPHYPGTYHQWAEALASRPFPTPLLSDHSHSHGQLASSGGGARHPPTTAASLFVAQPPPLSHTSLPSPPPAAPAFFSAHRDNQLLLGFGFDDHFQLGSGDHQQHADQSRFSSSSSSSSFKQAAALDAGPRPPRWLPQQSPPHSHAVTATATTTTMSTTTTTTMASSPQQPPPVAWLEWDWPLEECGGAASGTSPRSWTQTSSGGSQSGSFSRGHEARSPLPPPPVSVAPHPPPPQVASFWGQAQTPPGRRLSGGATVTTVIRDTSSSSTSSSPSLLSTNQERDKLADLLSLYPMIEAARVAGESPHSRLWTTDSGSAASTLPSLGVSVPSPLFAWLAAGGATTAPAGGRTGAQ